jgi:hypothetical protein
MSITHMPRSRDSPITSFVKMQRQDANCSAPEFPYQSQAAIQKQMTSERKTY